MEFRYGLLLTVLLFGITRCQLEDLEEMFSKKQYCGEHLSKVLSAICQGNYNTLHKKYKRSADVSVQVDVASAAEAMERYNLNLPYTISKESARSMLSRGRRKKRGVYNECCEKACSHEELRNYCAPRRYNRNTSDGR
ncbi:bombyxin F-1 isoform X2 [Aethina tumida]|uniref:bombyxin F-1 isoform X2 n=1 Tax=Aethina tumida TaxID=116153 RepID=UPI00096B1316|nr:bombyxin F-1 isoform X2 [Aethina tumida]XP_049825488.1 bombyxin F-1 isoform X2 [Aethina tumida]